MDGGILTRILSFGARWRWVVSFTLWQLYPRGKGPRYTLDMRLGGLHIRSGCCGEEKNSITISAGNQNPVFQPVSWTLYWLAYPDSMKINYIEEKLEKTLTNN
jgi:hypothetical protein